MFCCTTIYSAQLPRHRSSCWAAARCKTRRTSAYLGDLGGLSGHRQLALLTYRGTGQSETPTDTGSYRCDRLIDDVEALREHMGLDLLAHCAGANLAALYAARYPERIRKLVLTAPSTRAVEINATSDDRRELVRLREGEPWFAPASEAFETIQSGQATDADWEAITPFSYGRWDTTAQAHHANEEQQRNPEAAAIFGAEGAYDPQATRAALATFSAPVLLLSGNSTSQPHRASWPSSPGCSPTPLSSSSR